VNSNSFKNERKQNISLLHCEMLMFGLLVAVMWCLEHHYWNIICRHH